MRKSAFSRHKYTLIRRFLCDIKDLDKYKNVKCSHKQVRRFFNTVSFFLPELSSEKVCDPTDVADNEQVAFVAVEHPLKQLQVSSLISRVSPRAEQTSTTTV